jgi:hypothetical protein
MIETNDQYYGLHKLKVWYKKYNQQFIDVSCVVGTGIFQLIKYFLSQVGIHEQEVMYLSLNQKLVLELAYQQLHSYHLNNAIYHYTKIVDFDTLPVINTRSNEVKYVWKREIRKNVDKRYKLIVVFDSSLLNFQTIKDISTFGIPVILISDPMLLPAPDTYMFARTPNVELLEPCTDELKNPITYFAHKILNGERLNHGNYDTLTVVPKKQLNLYNLRSSDMVITVTDEMMNHINKLYREKVLKLKNTINILNERVLVDETIYNRKLSNPDNKKVKLFLTKGLVGYLSKCNKHAVTTRYIGVNFRPEFYHEEFNGLMMDRHHLNNMEFPSIQFIPDEIFKTKYAYALTSTMSRFSHWDKVTMIADINEEHDYELQQKLLYTGITRAKRLLNIIL